MVFIYFVSIMVWDLTQTILITVWDLTQNLSIMSVGIYHILFPLRAWDLIQTIHIEGMGFDANYSH